MERASSVVQWLPDPAYARGLALRSTMLWAGLRLPLTIMAYVFTGNPGLATPAIALLAAAVAALCQADASAMRETIFHGNLGRARWLPGVTGGVITLCAEFALRLVS